MKIYPLPIRWLAASLFALALSSAWLLDGPSEIEAMQDVSVDLHDATESVAISADYTLATGQNNHKTTVAAVSP